MEKKCENCKYYNNGLCWINMVDYNREDCGGYEAVEEHKPQTNRQWLETLSDEELANEIIKYTNTPFPVLSWLQSEHKE